MNKDQSTDQAKFDDVLRSERLFHGNPLGSMLRMQNQIDRTVGDGTLTGAEFCKLQERLAEQAGPKHSEAYMTKLSELSAAYKEAKGR